MRSIGNAIVLLLLVVVGFGFLLSHTITLTRNLTQTQDQLAQMQAEMQALEAQYQVLVEENNKLTGQVSGLTSENADLRSRMQTLENERLTLGTQIEALQRELVLYKNAHRLLAWLISSPQGHLAFALIVVPILPLSLGAVYVKTQHKAADTYSAPTMSQGQSQHTFHTELTPEEFQLIVQRRKSLAASRLADRPRNGNTLVIKR